MKTWNPYDYALLIKGSLKSIRPKVKTIGILLLIASYCIPLDGQFNRGPVFESPVVHGDRTVTFSYLGPEAKSVVLEGQFLKEPMPMVKNEEGLWTVTTAPVAPDIYPYSFKVDGIRIADPKNMNLFANEGF